MSVSDQIAVFEASQIEEGLVDRIDFEVAGDSGMIDAKALALHDAYAALPG